MTETGGRVQQIVVTARYYKRPSLGNVNIRKTGVNRMSAAVLQRNETFAGAMEGSGGCPAASAGVPWNQFVTGLRTCARNKGLGSGTSKSREYRMRFNKYAKTPKAIVA